MLLTRATTDLRVYERALEERGIPTYVIGGRGYWSHPQVIDMVAYLEALANPRAEEALYTVLTSPLVGVSADALVVLAAVARARESRPVVGAARARRRVRRAVDLGIGMRLSRFADGFAIEREVAGAGGRRGATRPRDRAHRLRPGRAGDAGRPAPAGERPQADAPGPRASRAAHGPDLRGFLELVAPAGLARSSAGEARESEAPVEGEALDAVRLMTIHRAKGLEFDVVCVADLGRGPRWRAELMRVGRDGRFGLRLSEPGTGKRESALDYRALGEERQAAEADEERRLFYVAMTRARERLILSGAAKLDAWPDIVRSGAHPPGGGPIAWIGPAVADLDGVAVTFVAPEDLAAPAPAPARTTAPRRPRRPSSPARPSRSSRPVARTAGDRAQLLLAGRVPPVRLPLLRRARARAAGRARALALAPGRRGPDPER